VVKSILVKVCIQLGRILKNNIQ